MALTYNNKTHQLISSQIRSGNACWAVLVANEYMTRNDPLRLAYIERAKLQGWKIDSELDRGALNGLALSEICAPEGARDVLGSIDPMPNRRDVIAGISRRNRCSGFSFNKTLEGARKKGYL